MKNIKSEVFDMINELAIDKNLIIQDTTQLIGDDAVLDSMTLVELCLKLEDFALTQGFTFDWTSESAMSTSRSMFKNAGALVEEFSRQKKKQEDKL